MKKLSAIGILVFMLLWSLPLLAVADGNTGNNVWIDNTEDKSVSYITGVVHITGSGGVQAGYGSGETVYSNQTAVPYSNPRTSTVEEMITAAETKVYNLANTCKKNGKRGEFHMSTSVTTGKVWDHRAYNTKYSAKTGEGFSGYVDVEYDHEESGTVWYKKEDGTLISGQDYEILRTHIATGDYGKETFYRVAADGWVTGYDVAVSNDGNGTGTADPVASLAGETVTLSASPVSGYRFKEWQVITGEAVLSGNKSASTTFTMPAADVEVKAVFEAGSEPTETTPTGSTPATPSAPVILEKDVWGNTIVSEQQAEKAILALPNDNDPVYSTFSLLQAKIKKVTKTAITVTWKRVNGATSYTIYGNKCGRGNKFIKLDTVSGTQYVHKKLKKGMYYKFLVVANGGGKAKAVSKTIHAATTGGKVGNNKAVKVTSKKTVTLKTGKTAKIKAKAVPKSKKLKVKKHRKLAYETDNPKVATVNKSGKIKAVGKGSCLIYIYAQDGVFAKVRVKVR